MLAGWKTYLVGFAMILYAVVVLGLQNGDWNSAVEMVLAALAVMGLRAGVAKVGK